MKDDGFSFLLNSEKNKKKTTDFIDGLKKQKHKLNILVYRYVLVFFY